MISRRGTPATACAAVATNLMTRRCPEASRVGPFLSFVGTSGTVASANRSRPSLVGSLPTSTAITNG